MLIRSALRAVAATVIMNYVVPIVVEAVVEGLSKNNSGSNAGGSRQTTGARRRKNTGNGSDEVVHDLNSGRTTHNNRA